jgi:hypothetical protein
MTSSLAGAFQNIQSPQVSDITSLSAQAPKIPGIAFPAYTLTPRTNLNGSLKTTYGLISGGPNQGLYAQLLPIDLAVTAQRPPRGSSSHVSYGRSRSGPRVPVRRLL